MLRGKLNHGRDKLYDLSLIFRLNGKNSIDGWNGEGVVLRHILKMILHIVHKMVQLSRLLKKKIGLEVQKTWGDGGFFQNLILSNLYFKNR